LSNRFLLSNRRTGGCKGARFDDLTIRRYNDLPIRRYNDSTIDQSIKIKHHTLSFLSLLISYEVKKLGSISSITFKKAKRSEELSSISLVLLFASESISMSTTLSSEASS